jgi:hypothetical protein
MCRWLAHGRDATAPPPNDGRDATAPPPNDGRGATAPPPNGSTPLVTVLHAPQTKDPDVWHEHIQQARLALSEGRVVVLLGVSETEPEYNWDEETLSRIACHRPDGANLEWQCMLL